MMTSRLVVAVGDQQLILQQQRVQCSLKRMMYVDLP